jgi:hypothetical protein
VGAATDFKSNIIISEELPEQLELEDWVTNEIFRTAIVIK